MVTLLINLQNKNKDVSLGDFQNQHKLYSTLTFPPHMG
jgi:hypothetical protein